MLSYIINIYMEPKAVRSHLGEEPAASKAALGTLSCADNKARGKAADSRDAPGYGHMPVCWKCSGAGIIKRKRKRNKGKHAAHGQMTDGKAGDGKLDSIKRSALHVEVKCPVCQGKGVLKRKIKEAQHANAPGIVTRMRTRPPGWQHYGILPVGNPNKYARLSPQNGEALTGLCGEWRIFQKIGGHRWSTEDIVTSWYASKVSEECGIVPRNIVDLGCGIGSVLLQCAWLWPNASLVGIEAQPTSAGLARRSIEYNTGESCKRVNLIEGDIRDPETLSAARSSLAEYNKAAEQKVDRDDGALKAETKKRKRQVEKIGKRDTDNTIEIVTGTPPYFRIKTNEKGRAIPMQGGMPSCINSAPARYEFRGGIEVYCGAAAHILKGNLNSPALSQEGDKVGHSGTCNGGVFIVSMAYQVERVEKAAAENGLVIFRRLDVAGKVGKSPLFSIYAMRLAEENSSARVKTRVETLCVRGEDSKHTARYEALMSDMGVPPVQSGYD